MKFCKGCGVEISDDSKYCSYCGESLTDPTDPVGSLDTKLILSEDSSIILGSDKLNVKYRKTFNGRMLAAISKCKAPIYYKDIQEITSKHASFAQVGTIKFQLINGKSFTLRYESEGLRKEARKNRNKEVDLFIEKIKRKVPLVGNSNEIGKLMPAYKSFKNNKILQGAVAVSVLAILLSGGGVDTTPFTKVEVCKGVVAIVSSRPVSIMNGSLNGGIVEIDYVRPDDRKRWFYRCKLEGSKGIWAMGKGRWRRHKHDEKITFKVANEKLYINTLYYDNSGYEKVFTKNSF